MRVGVRNLRSKRTWPADAWCDPVVWQPRYVLKLIDRERGGPAWWVPGARTWPHLRIREGIPAAIADPPDALPRSPFDS
jgi:hypothetical protein